MSAMCLRCGSIWQSVIVPATCPTCSERNNGQRVPPLTKAAEIANRTLEVAHKGGSGPTVQVPRWLVNDWLRLGESVPGLLEAYGQHHATCTKDVSPEAVAEGRRRPCSCGFDDARAGWSP